jgi:hypothetical protein
VDARTIEQLWKRLEEAGRAGEIRKYLMQMNRVTR